MAEITALHPRPEVLDFLSTRRSRPAKTLRGPGPTTAELAPMLTIAARAPDHGKLEPWRFIVLQGAALQRLAELTRQRGTTLGRDPDKVAKAALQFADAPLTVAVIAAAKPADIPEIEQHLSAGAVCFSLLNAALASGWGANWLSGWMATDRPFLSEGLDLAPGEWVAGFMVIGREGPVPPDRPRPDVTALTTWVTE